MGYRFEPGEDHLTPSSAGWRQHRVNPCIPTRQGCVKTSHDGMIPA